MDVVVGCGCRSAYWKANRQPANRPFSHQWTWPAVTDLCDDHFLLVYFNVSLPMGLIHFFSRSFAQTDRLTSWPPTSTTANKTQILSGSPFPLPAQSNANEYLQRYKCQWDGPICLSRVRNRLRTWPMDGWRHTQMDNFKGTACVCLELTIVNWWSLINADNTQLGQIVYQ